MIMEDPEWFMMFDKPWYSINHTHTQIRMIMINHGRVDVHIFPSPSIGSYDAWWFTARHEWQPQLMSSTLASGFFLTFIWMQLDMYYPRNPLRSSCYLSIHIYIYNMLKWYIHMSNIHWKVGDRADQLILFYLSFYLLKKSLLLKSQF